MNDGDREQPLTHNRCRSGQICDNKSRGHARKLGSCRGRSPRSGTTPPKGTRARGRSGKIDPVTEVTGDRRGGNRGLGAARAAKKDEFYTQLTDIEKEMRHYESHLKDKVIYCNADDPRVSAFFRFFSLNFERLGLKKLITTCYQSNKRDLFSQNDSEQAVYLEYSGDTNGNRVPDPEEIDVVGLQGDGDFRSAECVELLKQADVVVTNPPFSLFREYVAQLMKHKKKFVILGNMTAVTYKEVFPFIRDNKLWYGPSIHSGDREFGVPPDYPLEAASSRTDAQGNKFIRVKGVRWFTNLDYPQRHEDLPLYRSYTPAEYPTYVNFDAIDVSKTADIPRDYDGIMGVPISFLDKYSPEQFEIIGNSDGYSAASLGVRRLGPEFAGNAGRTKLGLATTQKAVFKRILIKRRQ